MHWSVKFLLDAIKQTVSLWLILRLVGADVVGDSMCIQSCNWSTMRHNSSRPSLDKDMKTHLSTLKTSRDKYVSRRLVLDETLVFLHVDDYLMFAAACMCNCWNIVEFSKVVKCEKIFVYM